MSVRRFLNSLTKIILLAAKVSNELYCLCYLTLRPVRPETQKINIRSDRYSGINLIGIGAISTAKGPTKTDEGNLLTADQEDVDVYRVKQ